MREVTSARVLVFGLVIAIGATACGDTASEAKRLATAQARAKQEGITEVLEADSRGVSGQGRELATEVRGAFDELPWFGDESEDNGMGVLLASFDGDSHEVSSGLTTDRSIARLCVELLLGLDAQGGLHVTSVDVPCPTHILNDTALGPNLPNTFQHVNEDGDLEWVTYEEFSRPKR